MSGRSHHFLRGSPLHTVEQRQPRQPDLSRSGYSPQPINTNEPIPSSPARSDSPTFLFEEVVGPNLGPQLSPPRPSSADTAEDTVIIATPDDAISQTSSSGSSLSLQDLEAPSDTEDLVIVNGERQGPSALTDEEADEMAKFITSVPTRFRNASPSSCPLVSDAVVTLLNDAMIIFLKNGAFKPETREEAETLNGIKKVHSRSLRSYLTFAKKRDTFEEIPFKIALNELTRRAMTNHHSD